MNLQLLRSQPGSYLLQQFLVGLATDLTYDYEHLGENRAALKKLLKRPLNAKIKDKKSVIVVGIGALNEEDGYGVLSLIREIADSLNSKILIMHTAASRVGAMDIGFVYDGDWIEAVKNSDVVYNLGADEINIEAGPFVIYQGSHGDRGAHRADLILPSAAYTEESGLFVNLEGRVQLAHRANFAPGDAKENWAILRALSSELDNKLPYDNLTELRVMRHDPHTLIEGCLMAAFAMGALIFTRH